MEIKIIGNASETAVALAQLLADRIRSNPRISIGFPTGRTMDAVYFHLSEIDRTQALDCSQINAFLLDEYIGLSRDDRRLFQQYMRLHLFGKLNFASDKIHVPNVFEPDLDASALQYEGWIRDCGGLDLVVLGVGQNGHIGFNEPGSAHDSRTRVVGLTSTTINANKAAFSPELPPPTALTMGIGTIMESKECVLIATGESKAEVIQRLVNGDVSSHLPVSALKAHKKFTLILDEEAASLIGKG